MLYIIAGSKEHHQITGRRKNLNGSEELVEDDPGDELMMDTTLKIGLKNIKGVLLNSSSSSSHHGWMRTTMMERRPPKLDSQFPSDISSVQVPSIHLTDMGMPPIGVHTACSQGQTEMRSILYSQSETVIMAGEEQQGAAAAAACLRQKGAAVAARPSAAWPGSSSGSS